MAKFLNTTGVSYHLEELIKGTKDKLFLVSPYLKFTDRVKEHLQNLNIQKRDIRIIYRENKLQPEENNWLEKHIGIRTSLCKNLHAKCYINENEAIITSMNLYEFSQQNNNEMGIYITKAQDPDLYNATFEEVKRLLRISEEIRITVKKIPSENDIKNENTANKKAPTATKNEKLKGYCIRTGTEIQFNLEKPLCFEAFKKWSEYSDPTYPEKFCHYTGEESKGLTSFERPVMKKNWKQAKEALGKK